MRIQTLALAPVLALSSLLALAPAPASLQAQDTADLTGRWEGTLNTPGGALRLAFEITTTEDGYSTKAYSIDQGNSEIPVAATIVDGQDVIIDLPAIQGEYLGTLSEDGASIDGTWSQGPASLPLLLEKVESSGD